MLRIDEVQRDIFRISYFDGSPIGFNQFLIRDEAPTLIHTGQYQRYDGIWAQIAKVLNPATLRYIVIPHFEADECGGMDRFLAQAAGAKLVCSEVGAQINLSGWNAPPPLGVWQDDILDLGRHRLRFLMAPHVHHWDSMMVFEETEGVLFPADLFLQPGDQPPTRVDLSNEMIQAYRAVGIMPS
jgi:flavorubredoxin